MPRFDVTIAGELNLDLILYGLPDQLPPERELLASGMALAIGGSSAIVAHNLAALGCKVGFISRIGDDAMGRVALEQLQVAGLDTSRVKRVAAPAYTGITVTLQRDPWRNMLTSPGTIADVSFEDLDFGYLTDTRHFHFSSYFLQKKLQPHVPEIFARLKSAGVTISVDTNDDPDDTWQGLDQLLHCVDVLMPNVNEARKISRKGDLESAVAWLAQRVPLVVVKQGEAGALAQKGSEKFVSPAVAVNMVDAVGAGDSFNAGFLSQYVKGADLLTCLRMGNLAGALSTTKPGGVDAFRDASSRDQFFVTGLRSVS